VGILVSLYPGIQVSCVSKFPLVSMWGSIGGGKLKIMPTARSPGRTLTEAFPFFIAYPSGTEKILPPTPKPSFSPVVLACPLAYRSPSTLGATVNKRFAPDRSTTHAAQRKARLRREQERILRDSSPSIPRTRQAIPFAVRRTLQITFCHPFVFMVLRIAFPATLLF
jgi:hypothetical protein